MPRYQPPSDSTPVLPALMESSTGGPAACFHNEQVVREPLSALTAALLKRLRCSAHQQTCSLGERSKRIGAQQKLDRAPIKRYR